MRPLENWRTQASNQAPGTWWNMVELLMYRVINHYWLVVWNMAFIFHFIYGMSSFPLTNSIIFQDGHIAPPTRLKCLVELGVNGS